MASFAHVVGGFANYFDDNTMSYPTPDVRFTRDTNVGLYIGAMFDMSMISTTNTDQTVSYHLGSSYLRECYTNSTANPVYFTTGVWGNAIVDTYGVTFDMLEVTNLGNGSEALNGVMYAPCGGNHFLDCFYGGLGLAMNTRNVQGAACFRGFGWYGTIQNICHNIIAGKSTGVQYATVFLFATAGARAMPRIGKLLLVNGGNLGDFYTDWTNSPDYFWRMDEMIDMGSNNRFMEVRYARNTGPITFVATQVASMNPASAVNTRDLIEAGADAAGPVIIVQNTNAANALIAMGGGTVLTTGAVAPGDVLTTEGGRALAMTFQSMANGGWVVLVEDVTERMTTLRVRERMSMGDHYAQTLRLWDERFSARTDEASALGFDAVFARMWHFYLCYSEAGFRSGYLDVQQIVLDRRNQR